MALRILSVSYDQVLLATRELLLKSQGYDVVSAEGFTEGLEKCGLGGYDLCIMGHSIPHRDKLALIKEFRRICDGPVLALLRFGEEALPEADYRILASEGPERLLETVRRIASGRAKGTASD